MNAWREAGVLITNKMLGELSYEGLLCPKPDADGWLLELPGAVRYRFAARRGAFESWFVSGATRRFGDEAAEPATDPRTLVVDARGPLGLTGLRLADVLAELTATLANEAARLSAAPAVDALATMDYDRADGRLTGHPRLVLNKGRMGFSAEDRVRYAPESGRGLRLRWLAVHPDLATFRSVPGLTAAQLLTEELGAELVAEFQAGLSASLDSCGDSGADSGARVDADRYVWMPVHPWQRDEIVGTLYAAELASGALIDLGESIDLYLPHQTIRTLANTSHPTRRDVKTALSVRNTLVYRGLASGATLAGPAVTDWLTAVNARDPLLAKEYRFELLGEVASVSVRHPIFGALDALPYRFHETLGALWREPIRARLAPGERAISFAALPYRDRSGAAMVSQLIRRSGSRPLEWFGRVLDLTLVPLLHWLLRYGVGFCPHGQNLILILGADGLPSRVAIKDFAQGVDLLDVPIPEHAELAAAAQAEMLRWPAHLLAQSLFSSVFTGQLRFLAEILLDDFAVSRTSFWDVVRQTVREYRDAHPDLASRFDACRLFDAEVEKVCLNTEHLAGQGFDKVDRDEDFDVRRGMVRNPLHGPDPGGAW
ncbi:MAG TPA: IucA/IucC family protein [Pseudonocardiaceae bacterium]|jgi:siderophore synthetase component|nr:IucA/IucC family protein [Pseudonocardiaceae bacterium]